MGAGNTGAGAIGRGGVTGGSIYQGISNTNPFAAYYANPFAAGLPSATGTTGGLGRTAVFGSPLYGTTSNSSNMIGGATGGTATISGGANQGNYPGSNSIGVRRAPAYSTTIAFDYSPRATSLLQSDVQAVLARSSKIQSKDTIQVAVDGDALVLRGIAKDDHERRLTEAIVRLTPGVRNLRNELAVILESAPAPRRVP
jgi:hypothetical protein